MQLRAQPRGAVARFFGRSPLHPDARPSYLDAVEESRLAGPLSRLEPPFTILASTPVADPAGRGDASGADHLSADHLVIGPSGVYAVNTMPCSGKRVKASDDALFVNGHRTDRIHTALDGAARASELLSTVAGTFIEVAPLIVVTDPAAVTLKAPKVPVVGSTAATEWFTDAPRVLSDDTIAYFSKLAEHPGIWRQGAIASDDVQRHAQRFERLRREVDAAHRRARACTLTIGAVAVAAFAAAFAWQPLLGFVGVA